MTQLEELLSRPTPQDIEALARLDGDLLILGAGGKMGPTLVQRAKRALQGSRHRAIGIGRSDADLLNSHDVKNLPDAAAVIYLVGRKFGSTGNEPLTWATNAVIPSLIGARYQNTKLVVLSSGNLYPFTANGATEQTPVAPVGEYAQSVLARERIFQYFCPRLTILRLNYAVEPRYGVLVDLATKIRERQPIDLTMGYVNLIWQGDANSIILRSIETDAKLLNVTGPEKLSIRDLATRIGSQLQIDPIFTGQESETALLSDASECCRLLGTPPTSIDEAIRHTVEWRGETLGKPTHFEVRTGAF